MNSDVCMLHATNRVRNEEISAVDLGICIQVQYCFVQHTPAREYNKRRGMRKGYAPAQLQ